MRLRFTKMHGLGNDFVMLDGVSQNLVLNEDIVRKLADRHFGIGCDQVLLVEPPPSPDVDFGYRIFNADGSEVENCGNGVRCFAVYVRERGLTARNTITVQTKGGKMILQVLENNQVTVDMGVPKFEPREVPFAADQRKLDYPLPLKSEQLTISTLSIGNPHAVTFVNDVAQYPVQKIGAEVERHPLFPNRVNAGFVEVKSRHEIRVRVFERGVGETISCGTGACAAMVAARLHDQIDGDAIVHLRGGDLHITWEGEGKPVMMTGPATCVFHGQIHI